MSHELTACPAAHSDPHGMYCADAVEHCTITHASYMRRVPHQASRQQVQQLQRPDLSRAAAPAPNFDGEIEMSSPTCEGLFVRLKLRRFKQSGAGGCSRLQRQWQQFVVVDWHIDVSESPFIVDRKHFVSAATPRWQVRCASTLHVFKDVSGHVGFAL